MMKSFFILAFLPLFSIAQNTKGIVVSQKDNSPIDDVNVYAIYNKTGTLTNEKGEFSLNLTVKENDTIQLSHVGYITTKIAVNDLKNSNFIISLPEDVENLSGLTIAGNHKLKLKSKLAFEELNPMPLRISSFGSMLVDGKIYVSGGDGSFEYDAAKKMKSINPDDPQYFQKYALALMSDNSIKVYKNKLSIYDIASNSWETPELKLKKRAYHTLNYCDGKAYILGGRRTSANGEFEYLENEIEIFDLKSQTIKIDKTNPHQAADASSFTYKDNIIVLGGSTKIDSKGEKVFTNKMHLYDIKSGYWYELLNIPEAKEATGTLINDKIYLITGFNGEELPKIETFDLITEKWDTAGTLFSPINKPAITDNGDLIYIFDNRNVYILNTSTKTLQQFTVELNLKNASMHYFKDKLYILGGSTENDYSRSPSKKVYSIAIEEFDTTKPDKIKTLTRETASAKL